MRGSPVTRLQMAASEHVQSSKAKQTRPHPSANDESVLSQKVYGKFLKAYRTVCDREMAVIRCSLC